MSQSHFSNARKLGITPPPPSESRRATEAPLSRNFVRDLRRPLTDLTTPTYILDNNFCYQDWNPAYEFLIGRELGIQVGVQGMVLVQHLSNCNEVVERSLKVFSEGNHPLVDHEIIKLPHKKYGEIHFRKLASQLFDEQGRKVAWALTLNILHADKLESLWADLAVELENEILWSNYSMLYDQIFHQSRNFEEYLNLLLAPAARSKSSLHLGVGTGLVTLKHLKNNSQVSVFGLEPRETSIEILRSNMREHSKKHGELFEKRLRLSKERIRNLSQFTNKSVDSILSTEALYRTDEPETLLSECARLLTDDGQISLATFHRDSDFLKFFSELKEDLSNRNLFDRLSTQYFTMLETFEKLEAQLKRFTKGDIQALLSLSGLEINSWKESDFQGGTIIATAKKVEKKSLRKKNQYEKLRILKSDGTALDLQDGPMVELWNTLLETQAKATLSEDVKFLLQDEKWTGALEVLDLGCGPGHFVSQLAKYFPNKSYTGLDLSEEYITRAMETYGEVYPQIQFMAEDLFKLETNKRFDYIIVRFVAQHVPDLQGLLNKIESILNPGGRVLFVESHDGHGFKFEPKVPSLEGMLKEMNRISGKGKIDRNVADRIPEMTSMQFVGKNRVAISSLGSDQKIDFMTWLLLVGTIFMRKYKIECDLQLLVSEFESWKKAGNSYGHWELEYITLQKD